MWLSLSGFLHVHLFLPYVQDIEPGGGPCAVYNASVLPAVLYVTPVLFLKKFNKVPSF